MKAKLRFGVVIAAVTLFVCSVALQDRSEAQDVKRAKEKKAIAVVLDAWYDAAAKANAKRYLGYMTTDSVFLGTDAQERWDKEAFRKYVEPKFDKRKGWSYHAMTRVVVIGKDGVTAWFDENLTSKHGSMRGSGVLIKRAGRWRIAQYNLSFLIPNEAAGDVEHIVAAWQMSNSYGKELDGRMFRLIIAGGQTGVDQAAHRAAQATNLLCAGWCPPDRSCETGPIPDRFPLQPTPYEKSEKEFGGVKDKKVNGEDVRRSLRTEWNVRDSDGTLIIKPVDPGPNWPADDVGTDWTIKAANYYHRPWHPVDMSDESKFPTELTEVVSWARVNKIKILNVAGASDKTSVKTGDRAYRFLLRLFGEGNKQPVDRAK